MRRRLSVRIISILVLGLLLFSMVFMCAYIAIESGHECQGAHCKTCQTIEMCKNLLHKEILVMPMAMISLAFMCMIVAAFGSYCVDIPKKTPVSLKTRIDD